MESRQFYTRKDKFVLWMGYTLLGTFVLAILVPLIYVILASFIDPVVLTNQGISFNPDHWTLEGYRRVFQDDMIVRGFINSSFTPQFSQHFPHWSACWLLIP